MSEVPTVSNVRQDLSEWQARHATLVLTTVKVLLSKARLYWFLSLSFCSFYSGQNGFFMISQI